MLGTQDLLDHQDALAMTGASLCLASPEQTIENLRSILVGRTLADVERHLILDTLAFCLGNRTHAARILGISIRTLRNKLNEYMEAGISVPAPGQRPALAA